MKTLEQRFWEKVDTSGECWLWTASCGTKGYGQFRIGRRMVSAHKVSYEMANGPVPDGLQVDHIDCVSRRCVRPNHLRKVTNKQNGENRAGARGASGKRGVFWNRNRWAVYVKHHGKLYYGGRFTELEDADEAARQLRNRLFTCNDKDRANEGQIA